MQWTADFMKQDKLTPAQIATASRLSPPSKNALRQLIADERSIRGCLEFAPRILDAAAVMFEGNVKFNVLSDMVRYSAEGLRQNLTQPLIEEAEKGGRPSNKWWTAERDNMLMAIVDQEPKQSSAISTFISNNSDDLLHYRVGRSPTLSELGLIPGPWYLKSQSGEIKKTYDRVREALRQRIYTLRPDYSARAIDDEFEEIEY